MSNRFIMEDDDVIFIPEDSQCKTCVYRDKSREDGWRLCSCEKYLYKNGTVNIKPLKISRNIESCKFYKSDK